MDTSNSKKDPMAQAVEIMEKRILGAMEANHGLPERTEEEQDCIDAKAQDDADTAMNVIAFVLWGFFACMAWAGIVYEWYTLIGYAVIGSVVLAASVYVLNQNVKREIATNKRQRAARKLEEARARAAR